MNTRILIAGAAAALSLLLSLSQTASGQEEAAEAAKARAEGQAGEGDPFFAAPQAERPWAEGEAGTATAGKGGPAEKALSRLFVFSGVTDDGAKGAATRKEATAILCTNLAAANTTIEVRVFNWNGVEMGSASVLASPNTSFTFSTQNTAIYFDDAVLGTGGGTDSIFQGFGEVWTDGTNVICTAEVLDPLGYPPAFLNSLELFRR